LQIKKVWKAKVKEIIGSEKMPTHQVRHIYKADSADTHKANYAKEPALFQRFPDTLYFVGHGLRFDTARGRANVQHYAC
jgi:hypothetical protein